MVTGKRRSQMAIDLESGVHQLVSDVAVSLGGNDEGLNPHQLLEAALVACTSITVQMYADRKGWPLESCNVEVAFKQESKERIVIGRNISFIGPLTDEQKLRLMQIAEKCPIHDVLTRGAEIETEML